MKIANCKMECEDAEGRYSHFIALASASLFPTPPPPLKMLGSRRNMVLRCSILFERFSWRKTKRRR